MVNGFSTLSLEQQNCNRKLRSMKRLDPSYSTTPIATLTKYQYCGSIQFRIAYSNACMRSLALFSPLVGLCTSGSFPANPHVSAKQSLEIIFKTQLSSSLKKLRLVIQNTMFCAKLCGICLILCELCLKCPSDFMH